MLYNFHFLAIAILLISNPNPSNQLSMETKIASISASPALLPDFPYTELSPEIAPLLPTQGGPASPTIPSTRSPNPDTITTVGPDKAAFPPTGPLEAGSSAVLSVKVEVFSCLLGYWLVMLYLFVM
ncbi:hydroxyproline-rich glycoprotein [Striga asiatica]|uniref:Hydroxyproline-rich glycoprotein n=1 Tax=Striga asiatica TaxID=4170 RepID=A0A5A7QYJ7_STRAF|nr:hydroxyproline-rich glycoprotein [Striga asiatica]